MSSDNMNLRKAAEMALESWEFFFSQAHPEIVDLMYGDDWAAVAKEKTEALRQALAQPAEAHYKPRYNPTINAFDTAPPKREWVGLTDEQIYEHEWWDEETAFAVNKEPKEKNT